MPAIADVEANYSVYGRLMISQPRLKSYKGDTQPDFLIVTSNSLNLYFNFIELEDANKKIFRSSGNELSTDFQHAYHQLIQWCSYNNGEVQDYCNHLVNSLFKDNFDS